MTTFQTMCLVPGEYEAKLSIGECHLFGKVAHPILYTPKHVTKDGLFIKERLTLNLQIDNEREDVFKLVVWGDLANTLAKECSGGRELEIIAQAVSYKGLVPSIDGKYILDHDGKKLLVNKVAFVVSRAHVGKEDPRQVEHEVCCGKRPQNWDSPDPDNHDRKQWEEVLEQREAVVYDGTTEMFGHAKVLFTDLINFVHS